MNRLALIAALLLVPPLALGACASGGRSEAARPKAPLSLRMDFDGAEALLEVLAQTAVTDAQIDRLLTIRGVQAMVDNTTKFVPGHDRAMFRAAVKEFVSTRKSTIGPAFRLEESHARAAEIRTLIHALRSEPGLEAGIVGPVARYLPDLGPLTFTVYSVAGGASDGFVPDDEGRPAFYMALNRASGDIHGVRLNMVHELFHAAHRTARARVPGLRARIFDPATAPASTRLLTVVLEEGAATHVAAPLVAAGSGPFIDMWRAGYEKNAPAAKISANFAEFDRIFAGLHDGAMSWDEASKVMYTGTGSPLYFVGYEMTKALDARHGPDRIAQFLQRHPAAFFGAYVDLYRKCPSCVPARFSARTEALIAALEEGDAPASVR